MRPINVTVGPLAAASANNVCTSQAIAANASFAINGTLASGGVATTDTPRRILFTASVNAGTAVFTMTGTDGNGQVQTESVTVVGTTSAYTALDYKTVTAVSVNASVTATVGTNGVASSPWIRLDEWSTFPTAMQATVTGTVNYSVQQTLQDPNSPTNPIAPALVTFMNSSDPAVVNATASAQSSYTYAPIFCKVTLNSGTGSVNLIVSQNAAPGF